MPQGEVVLFPKQERQVMSGKTVTYREKLLDQKIQLLKMALKANIQNQTLKNLSNVAKAKHDLLVFMRGDA